MWSPHRALPWRQGSRRFKEGKAYDTRAEFAALGPLDGVVAELFPEQARPLVHLVGQNARNTRISAVIPSHTNPHKEGLSKDRLGAD
jgi:hypothetical protein